MATRPSAPSPPSPRAGDDVASLLVRVGGGKLHRRTLAQPLQLKRQAGEALLARLAQEPQQQEVLVRPPAHRHQHLSRNVHPKYVQELLGHASIALTLDTYSHVLKGQRLIEGAVEELGYEKPLEALVMAVCKKGNLHPDDAIRRRVKKAKTALEEVVV